MSAMVDEPVELVARVCAIDIVVACVRVPHESVPGRRAPQVRELATNSRALLALVDWLRCERVELVAMEATSDYWKPVFYRLEAEGFTCWLLNARHVKNVPGRPKTDKLDAVWLAKVVEAGMCRPSLVHPRSIRQLRDLTRYRRTLVRERTREKQRLEKLLEARRSSWTRWSATCSVSLPVQCSKRWSPVNVTRMCSLGWPEARCEPNSPGSARRSPVSSRIITRFSARPC